MRNTMKSFRRLLAAVATILIGVTAALPALAQEYQKVGDKDPTTIAANPFIAGAYGFIWVAVLVYVTHVARGLGKVNHEIDQLRRKLDS